MNHCKCSVQWFGDSRNRKASDESARSPNDPPWTQSLKSGATAGASGLASPRGDEAHGAETPWPGTMRQGAGSRSASKATLIDAHVAESWAFRYA